MMPESNLKYANLSTEDMQKVHTLEQSTESVVVVMERVHPLANLSPEQVEQLSKLEAQLGVVLLAYDKRVSV